MTVVQEIEVAAMNSVVTREWESQAGKIPMMTGGGNRRRRTRCWGDRYYRKRLVVRGNPSVCGYITNQVTRQGIRPAYT